MKQVTLKSITFCNFKGEQERTTTFNPDVTTIPAETDLASQDILTRSFGFCSARTRTTARITKSKPVSTAKNCTSANAA